MPRLWVYIRTRDRNAQQFKSNERRLAPYPSRKSRQSVQGEHSSSLGDKVPLNGGYRELASGKEKSPKEELEMQIMRTETYEVTSQPRGLPKIPQRAML